MAKVVQERFLLCPDHPVGGCVLPACLCLWSFACFSDPVWQAIVMKSPQPSRCALLGRRASQGRRPMPTARGCRGLHSLAGCALPPHFGEKWPQIMFATCGAEATSLLSGFHIARTSGQQGQEIRPRGESWVVLVAVEL